METETVVKPRVIEFVLPLASRAVTPPESNESNSVARFIYADGQRVIAICLELFPQSSSKRMSIEINEEPHFHHGVFVQ